MNRTAQPGLAEQLMAATFNVSRDPRSTEYKAGALAVLNLRISGATVTCPFKLGTAQADAFYAGVAEGHQIWRDHMKAEDHRLMGTDRAALEIAHRRLHSTTSLDDMLQNSALRTLLESVARKHVRKRGRFDPKMAQANDRD